MEEEKNPKKTWRNTCEKKRWRMQCRKVCLSRAKGRCGWCSRGGSPPGYWAPAGRVPDGGDAPAPEEADVRVPLEVALGLVLLPPESHRGGEAAADADAGA